MEIFIRCAISAGRAPQFADGPFQIAPAFGTMHPSTIDRREDTEMVEAQVPLRRSRSDRMIGGVIAGLARYFGLDVSLARVLYVLVSILSAAFPGILVYIIMWILIPEEP